MTVDITASIALGDTEVHIEASHEIDGQGLPFTWIRVLSEDRSLLLIEDWTPGHLDESRVVRRAKWLVEAGSARTPAAHLGGMDTCYSIVHHDRRLIVATILGVDGDGQPFTVIAVADETTGDVLATDIRERWVTREDVPLLLDFLLSGEEPKPLATDDFKWVRMTLKRNGWVDAGFTDATESALAEVRYEFGERQVTDIHLTAFCSEWQQERLTDLLLSYWRFAKSNGGLLVGRDRVCLHDSAFEPVHDGVCFLDAWNALAASLEVEAQALLAEPQPADGLPC